MTAIRTSKSNIAPFSTWLRLGDLTLTLGRSNVEQSLFGDVLKAAKRWPDLHFVQPNINHAVGEFGVRLCLADSPASMRSGSSLRSEYDRSLRRRVREIPVEERMWCLSVLRTAYATIKAHVCKDLDDAAASTHLKTFRAGVTYPLHIDSLKSCEPQLVEVFSDSRSDKRLAFNIAVHIHPQSKLAQYFVAESMEERGPMSGEEAGPSLFQPPDWEIGRHPSTWGFEAYSTQKWDQTLEQWRGRPEQRVLKESVVKVSSTSFNARLSYIWSPH